MIAGLHLRNFKCFADQAFRIAPLTLLAGLNGTGKSSVIQSLLLLRQSYLDGSLARGRLSTSGALADLGTVSDVFHEGSTEEKEEIEIALELGQDLDRAAFKFAVSRARGTAMQNSKACQAAIGRVLADRGAASLFVHRHTDQIPHAIFYYLHAERNGPRKFTPMMRTAPDGLEVGARGEFALHFLEQLQDQIKLAQNDPRLVKASSERLRDQVEVWLNDVSPGVRLAVKPLPEADLMTGAFSYGGAGRLRSRDHRATNVGFGLSYVLPVIVALLAAPRGGFVVIENPEAHIHPMGQTKLGELCARAAAAGVQVLVETHSDHVLDGIRIAVREGLLKPKSAAFHYFSLRRGVAEVVSPFLDPDGRLSEWPIGFFDQHRRNTSRLISKN